MILHMAMPAVAAREMIAQPRIVHSIPGRVRLRFDDRHAADAPTLALRLQAHPAVWSVRWSPAAHSLTIEFPPALTLREVLLTAPPAAECIQSTPETARGLDWGRIAAACLLAALPVGVVASAALALVNEVAAQARDRR